MQAQTHAYATTRELIAAYLQWLTRRMVSKLQLGMPVAIALVTQLTAKLATLHDGGMGTIVCPLTFLVHRLRASMSTEWTLASVSGLVACRTQIDRGFALGTMHGRGAVLAVQLTEACNHRGCHHSFDGLFVLLRRITS